MELAAVIVFVMYFLPAIIAFMRGHASRWGILLLVLFLGWTAIGWFIALIWSASSGGSTQNIVVNNNQQVGK